MVRNFLWVALIAVMFAACAGNSSSTMVLSAREKDASSLSPCLPSDIRLQDVVYARAVKWYGGGRPPVVEKVTVAGKLKQIGARCLGGKLLDGSGREIRFYRLTGCWGNPPADYRDIMRKQGDAIRKLEEQYTVIKMTCNPSGVPVP